MRVAIGFVCFALCVNVCLSLRFASPLQTFTIFDNKEEPLPREEYLSKYSVGLKAEMDKRNELQEKYEEFLARQDKESPGWARKAAKYERNLRSAQERLSAKAFDEAVRKFERQEKKRQKSSSSSRNPNKYQFVGVINKSKPNSPIEWYARKRPAQATWSVRLVHVNKRAIIKDLFNQGKVDVMAKYHNTGFAEEETKERLVEGQYHVKERSWRTLWNFSPKHFFTDSSGMYWRERRVRPGVFTDGATVYETAYRYKDGKNGIRALGSLDHFLASNPEEKDKVLKKVETGTPDLVLEK